MRLLERHRIRIAIIGSLIVGGIIGGALVALTRAEHARAGTVYTPPASIDRTGATDVSDSLSTWIAENTQDGTTAVPNVIDLDGTFRVEYGLYIGNNGPTNRTHPGLRAYTRNNVVVNLAHATLVQKSEVQYSVTNGVTVEPRKRFGVPVLRFYGGNNIEVIGGKLLSTNAGGKYSAGREPWHGITIVGTQNLALRAVNIDNVWGDFVYINHRDDVPSRNVLIEGGIFRNNGRQGITFNAVDGLEVANVQFLNVQRVLFDHEPDRLGQALNINLHDNSGNNGGLGIFMSLRPLKATPIGNITVARHHLYGGHFRMTIGAGGLKPSNFQFIDNSSDVEAALTGSTALISFGGTTAGWNGVRIAGNHDHGGLKTPLYKMSAMTTNIDTSGNNFIGFKPM